jgi:hypothetical protein
MRAILSILFIIIIISCKQKVLNRVDDFEGVDTTSMNKFLNKWPPYGYLSMNDSEQTNDFAYINFCLEYQDKVAVQKNKFKKLFEYLDSKNTKGFVWFDFNDDGKKDLIFSGCGRYGLTLFYLMSEADGYNFGHLRDYGQVDDSILWHLELLDKEKLLITSQIKLDSLVLKKTDFQNLFIRDTFKFQNKIFYKNEIFIDYDLLADRNDIDTIKIKRSLAGRKDLETEVVFNHSKLINIYSSFQFSNPSNKGEFLYNKSWRSDSSKIFWNFVNSINFKKYKNNYSPILYASYARTLTTEIIFKDGSKKVITDYAASGPIALRHLYAFATMIKKTKRDEVSQILQ